MVQAHCVEPEVGDAACHYLGVIVFGETGAEAEVCAPELRACSVLEIEMSVLDLDEAVLACRRVEDIFTGIERRCRNAKIIRRFSRISGEGIGEPALFGVGRTNQYHQNQS